MHTAVILVGGIGSRLGSLTTNFPKPMLHVKDEPFLILLMKNVRRFGIKNFILLSGHANEILISHFEKNHYDFKVKIIVEKELLGTGGAIKNAVDILPNEFFCFNGDSILLGNWLKIKDLLHGRKFTIEGARSVISGKNFNEKPAGVINKISLDN